MRSVLLVAAAALLGTTVSAQRQPAPVAGSAQADTAGVEAIVARVLSFDRDGDGRVHAAELADRMQPAIGRGDADGNGSLDAAEIRAMATASPRVSRTAGTVALPRSIYTMAEPRWFPVSSHIEGAVDDLMLTDATRDRALAVVAAHMEHVRVVEAFARARLLRHLEGVLTADQLAGFRDQLARRPGAFTRAATGRAPAAGPRLLRTDLEQRILGFGLPSAVERRAIAALERHDAALRRRGEAERAALVDRMSEFLTDAQRRDLRAALGRQSAVRLPLSGCVNGICPAGGIVGSVIGGLPEPPGRVSVPEP